VVEAYRFDFDVNTYYIHKECMEEAERYDPSPDPYFPVTIDDDVLCNLCGNRLEDEPGDILNA